MNNNKMIRIAKNLDIFANVGGKITAGMGIACVLIAFLTLIFGGQMFMDGAITLDIDFVKFHLADNYYVDEKFIKLYVFTGCLGGGVVCFLVYYISTLFRKLLAPMKLGRPFEMGISENLRKIGWAVLIGGLFSESLGVIGRMLLTRAYSMDELFTSSAITGTEYALTMNLNFVLITCVLFFLSYIFTYGQALQQDSDETL